MKNTLNIPQTASVQMERMYCKQINFTRTDKDFDCTQLEVHFGKSHRFNSDFTAATVGLSCEIHDEGNSLLNLKVEFVGEFTCTDASVEDRQVLLTKNTLAILFPYLRSQISLATTQPDMAPITLPPMNIESLFSE